MCFYYDGYHQFQDDRVVTARKAHKCAECGSAIAIGEKYHRHSGKYDGNMYTEKVCRRCDYDRIRVVEHELAEGCRWGESWPPLGGLREYLRESGMGQTKPEDVPESFQIGDQPRKPTSSLA
jgi:hypothetical protein